MPQNRMTAADACLIWDLYQAAGQDAAVALATTRGYNLSSF
jgi:hypothetical protein